MNDALIKLAEYLKTDEGKASTKAYGEKLKREYDNKQKWINKFKAYFETLSDDEFNAFIDRFAVWDKKITDYYYDVKHCETNTRLFYILFKLAEEHGTENDEQGDFLAGSFKYRTVDFKLYCGQGCYYTLTRDGKSVYK